MLAGDGIPLPPDLCLAVTCSSTEPQQDAQLYVESLVLPVERFASCSSLSCRLPSRFEAIRFPSPSSPFTLQSSESLSMSSDLSLFHSSKLGKLK